MTDIIDIQVRDTGTTTAIKNFDQLGISADQAAKSTKGLQDALRLVSRNEFQKAKSGLASASASLASAQRDAAASASTLSGAQARSLQAEQKLLLARQKVATETARTTLLQAKAATEAQRAATLAAQQALAEDRLSSAIDRRAAAQNRAASATQSVNTSTQTATANTQKFTQEQKKLGGAAEANRMHMVNVSYQLQDIAVGLASGQRPMTVFIQQGAQLYGIAQMMNISLAGLAKQIAIMSAKFLANPFVLLAVGITAAALAAERYMSMGRDFNKALLTTNNYVGQSSENFDKLAQSIAKNSGGSFAQAASAMTAVAASGKIASSRFEEISVVATRMQRTVGTAVDDTVSKYAELGKAPVETLLKLNQTERFLTLEQYKRVKALEDEGKMQEAASEAIKIYIANQNSMAAAIEASRGPAKQMWDELTTGISNATTALGAYLVKAADLTAANYSQVRLGAFQMLTGDFSKGLGNIDQGVAKEVYGSPADSAAARAKKEAAELADLTARYKENRAAVEAKSIAQSRANDTLREYTASVDKSVARDLERIKVTKLVAATGLQGAAALAKVNALMAQYDEKNKGPKAPKGPSDGSAELLARLNKQNVLNQARVESETKLTETQRLLAEAQDYLSEKGSKLTAARRRELELSMATTKASGEAKEAAEREVAVTERKIRLQNTLAAQEAAIRNTNQMTVLGMTADSDTMERVRRRLEADQWYADELDKLRSSTNAKDADERIAQEAQLKESYARRLDMERMHQQQMADMRDDWTVGWKSASNEYVRNMTDGARQTKDLLTNAFKGAEDAFVRFVTTGKFSFSDFARSIIADLARIAAQKAIAGIVGAIGGMGGMGAATASTQLGNNYSWSGGFGSAKGNVFAGGTGLSASSNRVVNGYRNFQFANGGVFDHNGSMSERGAEAVMPLARDSSGRLGVKSQGGSGTPSVTVNIHGGNGDQSADAQANTDSNGNLNIDVFLKAAAGEVASQIGNRSGPVYQSMSRTFGLKPAVG